ncbi:MAG: hypothetical protein ABJG78_11300 [Cyclobacteriaceae bacterium]
MKIIKGFLFLFFHLVFGFILAAWITSLSIPKGSGLAGPGIVVGNGLFGAIGGLVLGIILLTRVNRKVISVIAIIGLVATLILGVLIRRKHSGNLASPKTALPVKPIPQVQ